MRRPARIFAIVGVLLVTLLAGCGLPWPFPQPAPDLRLPDSQQNFRALETAPSEGDVYALDPADYLFSGVDYEVAQLIFPQLVTLDERLKPVDWAAQSHEVSADGLTYTFHLRKGMTWSDGAPIDANTFAYSINRALDPCWQPYASDVPVSSPLKPIKGADAFIAGQCPAGAIHSASALRGQSLLTPDPLTLQIRLSAPAGYFLTALTSPGAWAVPEQLVERYTKPTALPDYRGNGALSTWTQHLTDNGGLGGNLFKLSLWSHPALAQATPVPLSPGTTVEPSVGVAPTFGADGRAHLVLERNERFWGQKPVLRRIEYTLYTRDNYASPYGAAWTDFMAGRGDVSRPPPDQLDAAKGMQGATYQETPLLAIAFLTPNWHVAPFDDARVRQAFSLAIDRQALARNNGLTTWPPLTIPRRPTTHLMIEGLPGYNPALRDPAGRSGQQALTADLTTARTLVAAYAATNCDGRLDRCPRIVAFGETPDVTPLQAALVKQWQTAFPGWPITATGCSRGCPEGWSNPGRLQLIYGGWGADYPDGEEFLSLLWRTGATYNRTGVSSSDADALLDQADASNDQSRRITLYQQAEQLLVNQVAAIPLFQLEAVNVARTRVVNWRVAPTGQTLLSVWEATYISR
jgi:ABC-type oligopeptide transport system substrate-binding subunit